MVKTNREKGQIIIILALGLGRAFSADSARPGWQQDL